MKHSFKNTNTIVIQGWMINELKLSGNELILYALIYGFSQDGESEFYGSLNYVSTALNCSKPTVIKALNSLIDKNLIFKNQNSINGIVYSKYSANQNYFNGSKETLLVKNNDIGSKESLRGSKETLPNNNIYNNIYNNKESSLFQNDLEDESLKTEKEKEKQAKEKVEINFDSLILYYNKVLNKKCRIIPKDVKIKFNNLLKDGYEKSDIKKVIDNVSFDINHKENNFKYVTFEFLSRPKIFERYASMEHKKPQNKDGHINW